MKQYLFVLLFITSGLMCACSSGSDSTQLTFPEIKTTSLRSGSTISAEGEMIGEYTSVCSEIGFCYSTMVSSPTLSDVYKKCDISTFSLTLNEIDAELTYYIRAYAVFNESDVIYGNTIELTPRGIVEENAVSTIQPFTDNGDGSIVVEGRVDNNSGKVTQKGFVYSPANEEPLLDTENVSEVTVKSYRFIATLTGLEAKTYYVRAYVIFNETDVLYGNVVNVEVRIDADYLPDSNEPASQLENGMKLSWSDEFNYTGKPDPSVWNFENGFARNQELQWYQDENAECIDGILMITGCKERVKNPHYVAGSSNWKENREYAEYTSSSITAPSKAFKYGRLLVRAKIPTGRGSWPAIWTVGNWWEWPAGGEIDILEYYLVGSTPSLHANVCWGSNTRWSGWWNSKNLPLADFAANDQEWAKKYHIWRMDWSENNISLYIDDFLMNSIDLSTTQNGSCGGVDGAYQNPFSNNYGGFGQYILLNLAIGANGGTPDDTAFPLKYYVDYVRLYQF